MLDQELEKQYHAKLSTVEEALAMIRSGDVISTGSYGQMPRLCLQNMHTIASRVEGVTVWLNNPFEDYPFLGMKELQGRIDLACIFYSENLRKLHASGRVSYAPHNLGDISICQLAEKRPNVFMATATPPDEEGNLYLPVCLQNEAEIPEMVEHIILEVNPTLPRVRGAKAIPLSRVTCLIEANAPQPYQAEIPVGETERQIASQIEPLVRDGDTIQFGYGGLPNALADAFANKNDLGIHTEMLTSSMARLMQTGVVNNCRKSLHPNETVFAFSFGTQALYDFIDGNPGVHIMPVSYVNNPAIIAQNKNMISVNSALQVDLTGQVCSESMGYRFYSGTGGAMDFAYGAFHAPGGRGVIALRSTAKEGTISRIQPMLTPGAVVTIPRNIVDMVVTEYGVAHLRGATVRERVERLIAVAHPDFRDELKAEAQKMMLW